MLVSFQIWVTTDVIYIKTILSKADDEPLGWNLREQNCSAKTQCKFVLFNNWLSF